LRENTTQNDERTSKPKSMTSTHQRTTKQHNNTSNSSAFSPEVVFLFMIQLVL
jgi:hypothetical protein